MNDLSFDHLTKYYIYQHIVMSLGLNGVHDKLVESKIFSNS
jgi:hypothetical protein